MMRRCLVPVILALLAAATPASAQIKAVSGRIPDFRFEQIVMNGDGRHSQSELIGHPILLEFWGTR